MQPAGTAGRSSVDGEKRRRVPELVRSTIDVDGQTHVGCIRPANEDNFVIAELQRTMHVAKSSLDIADNSDWRGGTQGHVLAVADGIALSGAGDLASTMSLHTLIRWVASSMPWRFAADDIEREELLSDFAATFERCHARLLRTAAQMGRPDRPMGTTLTVAYVSWPDLFVSHAGDSRCYLFRAGALRQLTTDHTLAQRLADDRSLPLEDLNLERFDNVLDNSVGGGSENVHAEVNHIELEIGDRILLCSDGLTKHLDDDDLVHHLDRDEPPSELCTRLIAETNERGGTDNVTVIVCDLLTQDSNAQAD